MSAQIDQALELLRAGVAELDPAVYDGSSARRLAERFAEIVRLGESGKMLEKELFDAARTRGAEYERSGADAFDALVALADASAGAGTPAKPGDTTLVVRIDTDALRGWTEPGEVCEIAGAGPIPVPAVQPQPGVQVRPP